MSAAARVEPDERVLPDPSDDQDRVADDDAVGSWLRVVLEQVGALARGPQDASDGVRIDRIAHLERIKAAAAAAQATEIVAFARSQVADQRAADVDHRRLGRGIADQVALACHVSSSEGSRRLTTARDLSIDLPRTLVLLSHGLISDYTAMLVASETRPLSAELRRRVDAELEAAGVIAMAPREAALTARRLTYRADPQAALKRARLARSDRRVTVRPAPDTMSLLTGLLPVEQGVACYAALKQRTDQLVAVGDARSRDQIMADTLVERLTGQAAAAAVPTEIQIVVPVEALVDEDDPEPADLPGYGPLPIGLVQEFLALAGQQSWWRRIFTATSRDGGRSVVDVDDRRRRFARRSPRRFPRRAARLIKVRDRWCRDPYCTAAIRHLDHIVRHTEGGPSTVANGRGVCERHNYVREMPGWSVQLVEEDPHITVIVTPTGHRYRSRAPNPL
jgi:hypothetical protein